MPNGKPTLCFIGFGEAGQAIASGLREAGVERISAWDILFPQREGEKLRGAAKWKKSPTPYGNSASSR